MLKTIYLVSEYSPYYIYIGGDKREARRRKRRRETHQSSNHVQELAGGFHHRWTFLMSLA